MRFAKWLLIIGVILSTMTVFAQDTVKLTPFTDAAYGIQGVIPEGWTKVAPGIYARQQDAGDPTLIAQQAAPASLDKVVASLLPQLQLKALPESSGTAATDAFSWTLYKTEVSGGGVTVTVDLALAEKDSKTYVILMQAKPDEYDALHTSVFLAAVNAFVPQAEATPEADLPYTAEDVSIPNGDVTLAGTLTLPDGDGPFPVVVLVTGSGPQDRDESLAPLTGLKPFAVIADYLTREGLAVLRYDDRGVGKSTGDYAKADLNDFESDASAAIDFLLTRDDIDHDQIGLLGHSEGGIIAAKLGATNTHLAFIVAMAGTAVKGTDLLLVQNHDIILANGGSQEMADITNEYMTKMMDAVANNDLDTFKTLTHDFAIKQIKALPQSQQDAVGDLEAYANKVVDQQVAGYFNDWFRSLLAYDPSVDWAKTTIPVLAVFGGKDTQVSAKENAPAMEAALKASGNTDYQIVTIPTANHLFQDAKTGGTAEYPTLPDKFVDAFLPTIGDWILKHVTLPA
ncbi:MAG: alpha/beta fold hydrolase [Chloroflexota bacterium]